jgi:lipopolysaccharide/colanic/teichoic acid biosynthesis glycosyltransferase
MTLHVPHISTDTPTEPRSATAAANATASGPYRFFFKRALDLTLVIVSLPVVLPLILTLALLIMLTGNLPFYAQQRLGRGGVPFRMWKLRTMVRDADEHLEAYLQTAPEARREWDINQKLKDDPRITPLGRVLRKTSIDELPQLFNVLNGTMSLVGPRPMMVHQQDSYHGQAYFDMRPGITGIWQVSERNDCSFEARVDFDNRYNREMSLKTDLALLVKTVGVVCRATGY